MNDLERGMERQNRAQIAKDAEASERLSQDLVFDSIDQLVVPMLQDLGRVTFGKSFTPETISGWRIGRVNPVWTVEDERRAFYLRGYYATPRPLATGGVYIEGQHLRFVFHSSNEEQLKRILDDGIPQTQSRISWAKGSRNDSSVVVHAPFSVPIIETIIRAGATFGPVDK